MRLFVAIGLPDDIRDYLFKIKDNIDASDAKIRWVAKKNIHLTLKFIGWIEDKRLDEVKRRLANVKSKRFNLHLDKLGWFPGGNSARVIWIGVEAEKDVIELQGKVDEKLLDILPGEQKFSSHLTLGRVKSIKNVKKFLEKLKQIKIEKIKFDVNEFSLIRSQLTRDGPRYSLIEKYNLS